MKILIAVKRSKWERDIFYYGSEDAVRQIYELQNHALDRVFLSHERQIASRRKLKEAVPEARLVFREDLPRTDFHSYDLALSLGGDNHFVYVAQFIANRALGGINSDPETSTGTLLPFDSESFADAFSNRTSDAFRTESWTGIECEIIYPGGQKLPTGRAISEISVRNSFPDHMSRYLVQKENSAPEEQKSSGLLLATGAGSTGWFYNSVPSELKAESVFPKNSEFFRFAARECRLSDYRYGYGEIRKGETIEIISEMDGNITLDSDERRTFAFPPGCRARFSCSAAPLEVLTGFA